MTSINDFFHTQYTQPVLQKVPQLGVRAMPLSKFIPVATHTIKNITSYSPWI